MPSWAFPLELDEHLHALADAKDSVGVVILKDAGRCFLPRLDLAEVGDLNALSRRCTRRRRWNGSAAWHNP